MGDLKLTSDDVEALEEFLEQWGELTVEEQAGRMGLKPARVAQIRAALGLSPFKIKYIEVTREELRDFRKWQKEREREERDG